MTKSQLKDAYVNWNKEIGKLSDRKIEILKELQDLCAAYGDGHKWCNIIMLIEQLTIAGYTHKAMSLASEYYMIKGKEEALKSLALATNNFDNAV